MAKHGLHGFGIAIAFILAAGCTRETPEPTVRQTVVLESDVKQGITEASLVAQSDDNERPFVGSTTCRDCHADFYTLWSTSWHGLAMQPYTAKLASAHFTAQQGDVTIGGRKYHAEISGDAGYFRETGPDGERKYRITHVMGGKNVYYFLTPMARGRLQVLPLAYDVHKKAWYDMAASGVRHFPTAATRPSIGPIACSPSTLPVSTAM